MQILPYKLLALVYEAVWCKMVSTNL